MRGTPRRWAGAFAATLAATLAACAGNGSGGSGSVNIANGQAGDPATVDFPIFYVKRSVPTHAAAGPGQDLRVPRLPVPVGADLFMRSRRGAERRRNQHHGAHHRSGTAKAPITTSRT